MYSAPPGTLNNTIRYYATPFGVFVMHYAMEFTLNRSECRKVDAVLAFL